MVVTEGQRIIGNRYQLTAPIGSGGVGVVWRARDVLLDREVAVKEIGLESAGQDAPAEVRKRTLYEARAAARIRHPGVAAVYDVIAEEGRPYIVMELIEGPSLAQVIKDEGPLALCRVADIGRQILAALTAGHAAGVLHRDLKPANVLVTPFCRAVLTDFGIASVAGDPSMTQAGVVLGTPSYLAPERARGEPATPETDIWSLGATLYAAASGRGPFDGHDGAQATLAAINTQEPPDLPFGGPVPGIIRALMDRDPRRRPSPAEAAQVLEREASGFSRGTAPDRRVSPPAAPPEKVELAATALALVPADLEPDDSRAAGDDRDRPPRSGRGRRITLFTAAAALAVAAAGATAVTLLHRPAQHPTAHRVVFVADGTPVPAVPEEFRVASVTGADGSLVLFAGARNGALMADRFASGSWSGWTSLPGGQVYAGVPAVVRDHAGRLAVVARTASGKLAFLWQSAGSGSWNGPVALGSERTSSAPAMVALPDGRLEVFARLPDGSLGAVSRLGAATTSRWSGWSTLGGRLAGPPAATLDSRGNPEVFAVASDGSLMRAYVENGAWRNWMTLPGGRVYTGVPGVGTNFDGRLEVFVRTSSGALEHVWQLPGRPDRWGGPLVLMTAVTGDPGVYGTLGGRIETFIAASGSGVRHSWQVQVRDGTPWDKPAPIAGDAAGAPVPVRTNGQSEVFVRTPDGMIAMSRQNASLNWSGWSSLGGSF